jgi:hypothetical protein
MRKIDEEVAATMSAPPGEPTTPHPGRAAVTDDVRRARLERPLTTGRLAWMADRWLAGCSQDVIGAAVDRHPSTVSSCVSRFCEMTGHELYGLLGEGRRNVVRVALAEHKSRGGVLTAPGDYEPFPAEGIVFAEARRGHAVFLREVEGLTLAATGKRLGVSRTRVVSLVRRAKNIEAAAAGERRAPEGARTR